LLRSFWSSLFAMATFSFYYLLIAASRALTVLERVRYTLAFYYLLIASEKDKELHSADVR
jgi:hypothetical protein